MKTLFISKPTYQIIFPLQDYPKESDVFNIESTINTISDSITLSSILFGKSNIETYYTGVIGNDYYGSEINKILKENNVNTDLIETSYQENTNISFKIYNSKTNKYTIINNKCNKTFLIKYKYEFIPDIIVMNKENYNANLAAINNYPDKTLIYIMDKYDKTSNFYCNKCNYIIGNINFLSDLTGIKSSLDKPKTIVSMYQKYIDLYPSNLIIVLDNFDVLYCINDEVRIIKNINKINNLKKDLYYSILIYFLSISKDIENSIKYTNKVIINTGNDLDNFKNISDINILINNVNEIINLNKVKDNNHE